MYNLLPGILFAFVIWYGLIGQYYVVAVDHDVDYDDEDEWFLDTIQEEMDEEEEEQ